MLQKRFRLRRWFRDHGPEPTVAIGVHGGFGVERYRFDGRQNVDEGLIRREAQGPSGHCFFVRLQPSRGEVLVVVVVAWFSLDDRAGGTDDVIR